MKRRIFHGEHRCKKRIKRRRQEIDALLIITTDKIDEAIHELFMMYGVQVSRTVVVYFVWDNTARASDDDTLSKYCIMTVLNSNAIGDRAFLMALFCVLFYLALPATSPTVSC